MIQLLHRLMFRRKLQFLQQQQV